MVPRLGTVLLIANPAAQNGKARLATNRALEILRARLGHESVVLATTKGPRHASKIAEYAQECDTVIALGGDGVIHEVANGLMRRPDKQRPLFGIIPRGSGNDYARSLGVSTAVEVACDQLLSGEETLVDVGRVNDTWFLETLSFGLDAAVAHDTVERRVKTGRTGSLLYLESGLDQLLHHLDAYKFRATLDEDKTFEGSCIMLAVQNGPYYGSGFEICPGAQLNDGLLDVCIGNAPISARRAVQIFIQARRGKHGKYPQMTFHQCKTMRLEFDTPPPAQTDGERLEGSVFNISLQPKALRLLAPVT